jgi:hypothetical protein
LLVLLADQHEAYLFFVVGRVVEQLGRAVEQQGLVFEQLGRDIGKQDKGGMTASAQVLAQV